MDINVNYKNPKKYKTAKYPIRQPLFFVGLIWVLSKIMLIGKKKKIEKIGMEGLKGPYILLSNHMSFIDFELVAMATGRRRVNNVVNIDGYYRRPWLLELIGSICTRKFTTDIHLIRSIHKVLERGDVLCMYPEARYSPAGTTSYLPDSLGLLLKRCKVPVVVAIHRGNYLHSPFWDFRKKRKVPLHSTFTKVFTPEDLEALSVSEINEKLKIAFEYDEYKYQKENGILITEPYRAEGLHKILYKCPHCKAESNMTSSGSVLSCPDCGKSWTLNEDGTLSANNGETEFSHIPDWFEWEREEVKGEIERGEYSFFDDVDVYSMPRCWKFENLGKATLKHDTNEGFVLEGFYRGQDYRIQRAPLQINSLHVEYDFLRYIPLDCIDISTENDSFYCYPTKKNVITKLAFATEEIFKMAYENAKQKRSRASEKSNAEGKKVVNI